MFLPRYKSKPLSINFFCWVMHFIQSMTPSHVYNVSYRQFQFNYVCFRNQLQVFSLFTPCNHLFGNRNLYLFQFLFFRAKRKITNVCTYIFLFFLMSQKEKASFSDDLEPFRRIFYISRCHSLSLYIDSSYLSKHYRRQTGKKKRKITDFTQKLNARVKTQKIENPNLSTCRFGKRS